MRYNHRRNRIGNFQLRISRRAARQGGGARLLLGQGYCKHQDDSSRENQVSADKSVRDMVCWWQRLRKTIPVGGTLTSMTLVNCRLRVGIYYLPEKHIINLLRIYVSLLMKHSFLVGVMMPSFTHGEYWIWSTSTFEARKLCRYSHGTNIPSLSQELSVEVALRWQLVCTHPVWTRLSR